MSRHYWRARTREGGFTFIELLVTIIIAGIAFAAMVPLFVQAQTVSSGDKMRAVALNIAQDRVEKLRQLDFELITQENLQSNDFYFGEFGSSWTEQTEGGSKVFNVDYAVSEKPVSSTDSRVAYKVVTVTVDWDGPPQPSKAVVLTTMIYRQYAGPQIIDFAVLPTDLGPIDPSDLGSETVVQHSPVHMQAVLNSADLDSMRPVTIGSMTRVGHVDFSVTSSTGTVYPKISVDFSGGALFPAEWTVPGGSAGAGDGYYSFKAVAYTSMGSPGNSWQLIYRIETGPPAAVTNLTGTAGPGEAYLTWDASTTGDVDHYTVFRDGVEVATIPHAAGSLGITDTGLTGPVGTSYQYTVSAVDWMGNETPTTVTLVSVAADSVAPLPATDLQGQAIDQKARLTWVASPSAGVVGYQVLQRIGTDTNVFTTATATLDVAQGWDTTAYYQVLPFVGGGVLSMSYSSILGGQAFYTMPDGVAWLQVDIGPEPLYTLVITNTTNKTLTKLQLYYLGPTGTAPQQEITPSGSNVALDATHSWKDLSAGVYRWDWVTSNNKTGSQTTKLSGAVLTIYGGTP
jgi:prepilin-type N-terminal cleavage/methylation domain-containing protein